MKYLKVNEALDVVAVSDSMPAECKAWQGIGHGPSPWARNPVGQYSRDCQWSYGAGWLARDDISQHPAPWMLAQHLADSASKLGGPYLAIDNGPSVSPRYEVVEAPKVGDEVSKGFNGDYYPVGRIVAIQKNYKRIRVEGPRGPLIFCRKGEHGGAWLHKGMWGLVPGKVERWNPEF